MPALHRCTRSSRPAHLPAIAEATRGQYGDARQAVLRARRVHRVHDLWQQAQHGGAALPAMAAGLPTLQAKPLFPKKYGRTVYGVQQYSRGAAAFSRPVRSTTT